MCNLKKGVPPGKRTKKANTPKPCMTNLTKRPLSNHDLAFRTHSLQMILYGPIHVRTQLLLRFVSERDPTIGAVCGEAYA